MVKINLSFTLFLNRKRIQKYGISIAMDNNPAVNSVNLKHVQHNK